MGFIEAVKHKLLSEKTFLFLISILGVFSILSSTWFFYSLYQTRLENLKMYETQVSGRINKIHTLMSFMRERVKGAEEKKDLSFLFNDRYTSSILGGDIGGIHNLYELIDIQQGKAIGPYGLSHLRDIPYKTQIEEMISKNQEFGVMGMGGKLYFLLCTRPSSSSPKFLVLEIQKSKFLGYGNGEIIFCNGLEDLRQEIPVSSQAIKVSLFSDLHYKDHLFNDYIVSLDNQYVLLIAQENIFYLYLMHYGPYYILILMLSIIWSLFLKKEAKVIKNKVYDEISKRQNHAEKNLKDTEEKIKFLEKQQVKSENFSRALKEGYKISKTIYMDQFSRQYSRLRKTGKKLEIILNDLEKFSLSYPFIKDVLDLAATTSQDIDEVLRGKPGSLKIDKVNITEILEEGLTVFNEEIFRKEIKCHIADREKDMVSGDKHLLNIIFINYLRSAISRLSYQGSLKISYVPDSQESFLVEIWDNGYAFNEDKLRKYDIKCENRMELLNLETDTLSDLLKLYGGEVENNSQSLKEGNHIVIRLPKQFNDTSIKEIPKNVFQFTKRP